MEEEWRDIEGYEGLYQVSNLGRVRSLDRTIVYKDGSKRFFKGRILSQRFNQSGYLRINLSKNSKITTFRVNRLVAQAFIPNPDNLPCVNHRDEDKTNNCVDNLEWCDVKYNNNYGVRLDKIAKTNSIPIVQLTIDGDFVARYESATEAAQALNINNTTGIIAALKERHYTAYDYCWWYEWEYENIYGKGSVG